MDLTEHFNSYREVTPRERRKTECACKCVCVFVCGWECGCGCEELLSWQRKYPECKMCVLLRGTYRVTEKAPPSTHTPLLILCSRPLLVQTSPFMLTFISIYISECTVYRLALHPFRHDTYFGSCTRSTLETFCRTQTASSSRVHYIGVHHVHIICISAIFMRQ